MGTWPPTPLRSTRIECGTDARAARIARETVDAHLAGAVTETELRDLRLLISELVNNAVLHGDPSSGVVLHLAVSFRHVRVEVCDGGPGFTPPPLPDEGSGAPGFGLSLLDRMASRWGVSGDDATCVWLEIDR